MEERFVSLWSLWIDQLKAGDRDATSPLWERYFRRLVGLARQRLSSRPRLAAGAEDVALSAFDSSFRGAENGRFPRLQDRNDLWHVLVTIAEGAKRSQLADDPRRRRPGRFRIDHHAHHPVELFTSISIKIESTRSDEK